MTAFAFAALHVPDTVVKNFALTGEQAEWLRDEAYRRRIPQAEIVRQLITKAMQPRGSDGRWERKP